MYRSTDLKDWTLFDRLTMPDFGYMWECPDLFELDGELFLVFSPQGLEAKGWDNRNVYQTGYCRLDYDFDTKEYAFSPFQELDRGFDYYAPQSFLDEQGRHIQFGWMGMGDAPYTNAPTIEHAWQHALTLPRELRAKDGHLYQMPIVEIEQLRQEKYESSIADFEDPGFGKSYEMIVTFAQSAPFSITVDDEATLAYDGSVLRLTMKEGGYGRDERGIEIDAVKNIRLFKDTSSLEIFVNDGWTVFSSRVYSTGEPNVRIEAQGEGTVTMYELDSIGLSERDRDIAYVTALFHDIGRFEQLRRYGTFVDYQSVDHADLGVQILKEEGLLDGFGDEEKERILTAIALHNKYELPMLDEKTLLLARMIRDADKCDIFRVFASKDLTSATSTTLSSVQDEVVSAEIERMLFEHRCVEKEKRKTGLDVWMTFLGFFFDMNFSETIRIAKKQGYYRQPFDGVAFTRAQEQIDRILAEVERYIDERLQENV